jgi:TruD family tRNA pseudouridine synthase
MEHSSFQLFKKQSDYLKILSKERPDLFISENKFDEKEALSEIGVVLPADRKKGFLQLYPQDFIVEEVKTDGSISEIEPKKTVLPETGPKPTLYADLIKVGISSLEAIDRLAKKLNIDPKRIGYAGIKDAVALTSQRIALPGFLYEDIQHLNFEGFFLTNFSYGKGTIAKGELEGNRFSIFVRTEGLYDPNILKEKLLQLKKKGFLNYYHFQRFGGARLSSHIFGRLILKGEYEEAIKQVLTYSNKFENKINKGLKLKVTTNYGNWEMMKKTFELMPYTFQNQIKIIQYLIENPGNFIGALIHIKEQTTLWIYAYASILFNRCLSENNCPDKLPLLLTNDPSEIAIYRPWLKEDGISSFQSLKPFKFIQLKPRFAPTRIFPEKIIFNSDAEGVAISFILDKGAYATTFLNNIFELWHGLPIPQWVKKTEQDTKKILNLGSNAAAKNILEKYIFSILDF